MASESPSLPSVGDLFCHRPGLQGKLLGLSPPIQAEDKRLGLLRDVTDESVLLTGSSVVGLTLSLGQEGHANNKAVWTPCHQLAVADCSICQEELPKRLAKLYAIIRGTPSGNYYTLMSYSLTLFPYCELSFWRLKWQVCCSFHITLHHVTDVCTSTCSACIIVASRGPKSFRVGQALLSVTSCLEIGFV